ncbi:MAG: hypothetical protein K9L62_16865 [Vallitaleaceae bacterium]|nr:hypothetical protein [Vallitaleaceae bacterium]
MTEVFFNCEKCNTGLVASFSDDDSRDTVHCTCGKVWAVLKPIETVETVETVEKQ